MSLEHQGKKILMVLTSTSTIGESGHLTGSYLSEITHPYDQFVNAGDEVDFISPLGGRAPLDGVKMDDPLNITWMNNAVFISKLEHTLRPWQVCAEEYSAIYFAGGHGAMFDFPENKNLQKITAEIFENDGVVAAICHGVAGLVNVHLPDGSLLIQGHKLTCFSNEEEKAVGFERLVPFLLQTRLQERGAQVVALPNFSENVVVSGRLVTGQNPDSATTLGEQVVKLLDQVSQGRFLPEKVWCDLDGKPRSFL
jgi:putative intracellular protease/amidase